MHLKREVKGMVFLVLIFVILVTLSIVVITSLKTDPVHEKIAKDPVIKMLLVVEDNNKAIFTDLLIYYPVTEKGALVNIPGNTGSIFETLNRVDRIDAIFEEKGIDTYVKEVENLVGMPIPFYLRIKLDDFVKLTDILGGLEVFIPSAVDVTSSDGQKWLLPSGAVRLDGDKIRTYVTYKLEEEDEEEIQERRQTTAIALIAAFKRCNSYIFSDNNFEYCNPLLTSNIKDKDLKNLLQQISKIDAERITALSVTGKERVVDGKTLLFPFRNGEFIKEVVRRAANTIVSEYSEANTRTYILEIQNGTKIQGLAHNTSILLQGAGFEVLNVRNAEFNDYEDTQIIDHIGNPEVAKSIGDFINCTNIVEEQIRSDQESASNVDFTIILAKDFDGRYVNAKKSSAKNVVEETTTEQKE